MPIYHPSSGSNPEKSPDSARFLEALKVKIVGTFLLLRLVGPLEASMFHHRQCTPLYQSPPFCLNPTTMLISLPYLSKPTRPRKRLLLYLPSSLLCQMNCRSRLGKPLASCRCMTMGGRIVRMSMEKLGWFQWSVWHNEALRGVWGDVLGLAVLLLPKFKLFQGFRLNGALSWYHDHGLDFISPYHTYSCSTAISITRNRFI